MLRSILSRWMLAGSLIVGTVASAAVAEEMPAPASCCKWKNSILNVKAPDAKVGQPITIPIPFNPPKGWFIVLDFPLMLRLFPPKGVAAQKLVFKKADAALDVQQGQIEVVLTPQETGPKIVPAVLSFGIFNETYQDIHIAKVFIEMDVQ